MPEDNVLVKFKRDLAKFKKVWQIFSKDFQNVKIKDSVLVAFFQSMEVRSIDIDWNDSKHFFAAAARCMRFVLVDDARRRQAQKRGGGQSADGDERQDGSANAR